jgi:hypothetical protein
LLISRGVQSPAFAFRDVPVDPEIELKPAALESSPSSDTAPDVSDQQSPADPSTAKDEERTSLLDAVKSALDDKEIEDDDAPIERKAAKAEPSTAEGESSKPDASGKPDSTDVSDDALLAALEQLKADVPLNKIERFREVLTENRQLKGANERYKALDTTLTDIGNDARRMGLSNDELAQLFAWPRLLAKDPTGAVEQLQAFAANWQERIGQSLPADLKAKVDDGVMDEPTAKEVAQLRASNQLAQVRTEADTEDRERATFERTQNEIRTSVNAYQAELKANDPDYTPEKHAMTVDALTAIVATRGVPQTVADARAMAKAAYDTVTKRLSAFKPQPRALASPATGRRINRPAESQPKTMTEAVLQALGE